MNLCNNATTDFCSKFYSADSCCTTHAQLYRNQKKQYFYLLALEFNLKISIGFFESDANNWRHSITLATACRNPMVEALSELAMAENDRTLPMMSRLGLAKKAFDTFSSIGATHEKTRSIMLLVRLEVSAAERSAAQ